MREENEATSLVAVRSGGDDEFQHEAPEFLAGFEQMFAGEPSATVWVHPAGDWVEW